ncbi:MAG TPA: hypothetical protein DCZ91_17075 [Lachnospiraceae bacterium]|nr:hypothetical protein [Lachnospiraceae bacterium]
MEKIIEIEEGRSLNFKASAFSPIMYNRLFPGRDYMKDIEKLKDAHDSNEDHFQIPEYELFARISYLFAYQGMAPSPRQTQEQKDFLEKYPDVWDWIDSFKSFSIYKILPEIAGLWKGNEVQVSKSKNRVPAPPEK